MIFDFFVLFLSIENGLVNAFFVPIIWFFVPTNKEIENHNKEVNIEPII